MLLDMAWNKELKARRAPTQWGDQNYVHFSEFLRLYHGDDSNNSELTLMGIVK